MDLRFDRMKVVFLDTYSGNKNTENTDVAMCFDRENSFLVNILKIGLNMFSKEVFLFYFYEWFS